MNEDKPLPEETRSENFLIQCLLKEPEMLPDIEQQLNGQNPFRHPLNKLVYAEICKY